MPKEGGGSVVSFNYDYSKKALYLNLADTVLLRHTLGHSPRRRVHFTSDSQPQQETVFSLKTSCKQRIKSYQAFPAEDKESTILAVLVGEADLCVMRLNHRAKTFKQAQINIENFKEEDYYKTSHTMLYMRDQSLLMVEDQNCLILNLDQETLTVMGSKNIKFNKMIIPMVLENGSRVPCEIEIIAQNMDSTTSKDSQAISLNSHKRSRKAAMSITANLKEFLLATAEEKKIHHRTATSLFNRDGSLENQRQPSSRTLFIRELQQKSNLMTEKIRRIELSREARRIFRLNKAPSNHQHPDEHYQLTLLFPLCRCLDRLFRLKRDLKLSFDLIKRDSQKWVDFYKALKKLNRVSRGQIKRVKKQGFQDIKQEELAKIQEFKRKYGIKRVEYRLKAKVFKEIKSVVKKDREARIEGFEKIRKMIEGIRKKEKEEAMRKIRGFQKIKKEERIVRSQKIGIEEVKKESKRQKGRKKVTNLNEIYEEQHQEEEEEEIGKGVQKPGHRASQLSISYIVAKSQEEQQEHQTLDDEEDHALFQKLFEKYHQEVADKNGHDQIPQHKRIQSQVISEQTGSQSQGILSPTSNSNFNRDFQCPDDSREINKIQQFQPGNVFDYKNPYHRAPQHFKRFSVQNTGVRLSQLLPQTDNKSYSISVSNIEEIKGDDQDETNMRIAQDMQNLISDKRGDFSFSIDHDRGYIGVVSGGNELSQGKIRNSQSGIPLPITGFHRRKQMSVVQSRNSMKQDPGLVLLNSKQEREKAALNELNDILNERILSHREERPMRFEDNAGYYETLGTHRANPHLHHGYNHQLEQETANFNREDWMNSNGGQPRSGSSRSNNPIRAEKNSVVSKISTVQYSNAEHRQSPFQPIHASSQGAQDTCEFEENKTLNSKSPRERSFSPPKVLPSSIEVDQYKPRDDSEYLNDGLIQQSHYANFSQDFISPDELQNQSNKRSGKGLSNNTPRRTQTNGSIQLQNQALDTSGATTPAQQSAFELFRNKLNANLQNIRSQSHSRAVLDSIEDSQNNSLTGNNINLNRSKSQSQSLSISEPKDDGFQSKRVSLNNQQQYSQLNSIVPPKPQIDIRKITQSPVGNAQEEGPMSSRDFMAFVSSSIYQQLQSISGDIGDQQEAEIEQEINKTMRYVEPFTQRASLTNLELAEPMEIGGGPQSSINESQTSNVEETEGQEFKYSPIKESVIGKPSITIISKKKLGFSEQNNEQINHQKFYQPTFGVEQNYNNAPIITFNQLTSFPAISETEEDYSNLLSGLKNQFEPDQRLLEQRQFTRNDTAHSFGSKPYHTTVSNKRKKIQEEKKQSMYGNFTKISQGKTQKENSSHKDSVTFGQNEETVKGMISDRILGTYASIKTTEVIVELTEDAESSVIQTSAALTRPKILIEGDKGLNTIQTEPIQFFNFMPTKAQAKSISKPTMVLSYALGGQPRALTPSDFTALPDPPSHQKEFSAKKEPLLGDVNELLASRESTFRSTFEELRLSTDGISSIDQQGHPNFFQLHRVPINKQKEEKKKISAQINSKSGAKTKVASRVQSPKLPFSPNNRVQDKLSSNSKTQYSNSSFASVTLFDARRVPSQQDGSVKARVSSQTTKHSRYQPRIKSGSQSSSNSANRYSTLMQAKIENTGGFGPRKGTLQ